MEKVDERMIAGFHRKCYKGSLNIRALIKALKDSEAEINVVSFTEQAEYSCGGGLDGSFPFDEVCEDPDNYLYCVGRRRDNSITFVGTLRGKKLMLTYFPNERNWLSLFVMEPEVELEDIINNIDDIVIKD